MTTTAEVLHHSRQFGRLSERDRARILRVAVRNDRRGALPSAPTERGGGGRNGKASSPPRESLGALLGHLNAERRASTRDALANHRLAVAQHSKRVLFDLGVCPLLEYSFGRWVPADSGDVLDPATYVALQELAIHYLFRLVPRVGEHRYGTRFARGAYADVYKKGGDCLKVGRNLAATLFVLREEAAAMDELARSVAREHVPRLISFDAGTGHLVREFVTGTTGHDLLVEGVLPKSASLMDALDRTLDKIFEAQRITKLHLDLHPANFIWNGERWYLVDCGPIPRLARIYYQHPDRARYLRQVWLGRIEAMRTVPIRSVDLSGSPRKG